MPLRGRSGNERPPGAPRRRNDARRHAAKNGLDGAVIMATPQAEDLVVPFEYLGQLNAAVKQPDAVHVADAAIERRVVAEDDGWTVRRSIKRIGKKREPPLAQRAGTRLFHHGVEADQAHRKVVDDKLHKNSGSATIVGQSENACFKSRTRSWLPGTMKTGILTAPSAVFAAKHILPVGRECAVSPVMTMASGCGRNARNLSSARSVSMLVSATR